MSKPSVVVLEVSPGNLALLQRLRRTAGDEARDRELNALRTTGDELADELADLRIALDAHKTQILRMAETDPAWRKIADLAWPVEEDSDGA
jgi:hypothetical protein